MIPLDILPGWLLPFAAGFCACALWAQFAYYMGRRAAVKRLEAWRSLMQRTGECDGAIDWEEYEKAAKAAGAREP